MDLYVVLKRFGAILWPETAFIGPLTISQWLDGKSVSELTTKEDKILLQV